MHHTPSASWKDALKVVQFLQKYQPYRPEGDKPPVPLQPRDELTDLHFLKYIT